MNEDAYQELYAELEKYDSCGVPMTMDGVRVSPMQIVSAHMVRETGTYMRDYIMNDAGNIEQLAFQQIKNNQK